MTEAGRNPLAVRVECYAGYRGEETPRRFWFGENCIEVAMVIDRWLAPDHRYFKLRGDDGGLYILRHDTVGLCWELTLYEGKNGEDLAKRHNLKGSGHVQ